MASATAVAPQFDVQDFNAAAQTVYDQAYKAGERHGREAAVADNAKRQAVGSVEVAQQLARFAHDLEEAGRSDDAQRAADITRMLLGRTPHVVDSKAIAALDELAGRGGRRARGRGNVAVLADVIAHLDEDLDRIKTRST